MKKRNLVFVLGLIACFLAAYRGMVFSPSFTMMFVVAGMGFCIAGFCITEFCNEGFRPARACPQKHSRNLYASLCSKVLYIIGMIWVFPAVIIYATGDDWMNGCMKAAGISSMILCGIWLGWMWKNKKIQVAVWGKAVELLISLAAALLAVFCGINSVALLPYGFGLLLMTAARLSDGDDKQIPGRLRKILFFSGIALASLFPVIPAVGVTL